MDCVPDPSAFSQLHMTIWEIAHVGPLQVKPARCCRSKARKWVYISHLAWEHLRGSHRIRIDGWTDGCYTAKMKVTRLIMMPNMVSHTHTHTRQQDTTTEFLLKKLSLYLLLPAEVSGQNGLGPPMPSLLLRHPLVPTSDQLGEQNATPKSTGKESMPSVLSSPCPKSRGQQTWL